MKVLKWTGIVFGALLAWAALIGVCLIFSTGPVTGEIAVVTLGIVVVVCWLATTGRLDWMGGR